MFDLVSTLAQIPALPASPDMRLLISVAGLVISFSVALFSVTKYILTLKVDPLTERMVNMETKVGALQHDLLQQVIEIAEANNRHRLEQVKHTTDLRLLLANDYVKKADLEKIIESMERRTADVQHVQQLLTSVQQLQKQWSDLNK